MGYNVDGPGNMLSEGKHDMPHMRDFISMRCPNRQLHRDRK